MAIRIQLLPANDPDFAAQVRMAIDATRPTNGHRDDGLVAGSESDLRRALSMIRSRYRDVWIRRQDPMASVDGVETWYVFRDEAVQAAARTKARSSRA